MGEYIYKLIIIGDPAVGKTSLINRFIQDQFESEYKETIGTNIVKKVVKLEKDIVNFTIWDIAGQERWTDMRQVYYKGAAAAMIVYDVTRKITFQHVENYWYPDLKNFLEVKNIPLILIANKNDLQKNLIRVNSIEGEDLASHIGALKFIEASARTGHNVDQAFTYMAKTLLAKIEK
ncbi:MAG: GTP-binding protein [Candidatus Lokiarchaeota archaeon]|nr:GTP-binding protein [Candidatus Lokiarchaeota archaeon]